MSTKRSLAKVVLLLVLLTAPFTVAVEQPKTNAAIAPVPRVESWWLRRYADNLDRVDKGNVDLLFIGDSITQGWFDNEVWQKYYGSRNAVNMGFGGDQTQHVIWRVMNLPQGKITPKVAVIMIGTNNSPIHIGFTAQQIAEGNSAIIKQLQQKFPNIKVLLLGVFPRVDQGDDVSEKIKQINILLSKMADRKTVFFLDIGDLFKSKDGSISKDIMPDGLHLSAKGYSIWAEAMEPSLKTLLAEKTEPASKY